VEGVEAVATPSTISGGMVGEPFAATLTSFSRRHSRLTDVSAVISTENSVSPPTAWANDR
jgi:hypothetical protein